MAGSKWDEVLENLTEIFKHHLSGIDRQDVVPFCVNNKHIRSIVSKYLQNIKKTNSKSPAHFLAKYKQGKKLYNENKQECLSLYNSSIAHASKDDPVLPEVYNSRSLVLYQLEHFSESLQDLEMALENGHIEDSEVILRKARCLVKLGIVSRAKDILSCSKLKEEMNKLNNLKEGSSENNLPKLKGGENESFACASKYIDMFYNTEKGRHVIANEDLHPGDVLFIEKPFAFVLFKDVCHNCCKKTVAPVFCWQCTDVSYCSPQCRDDCQETFHQFECGFGNLFKSIGIAHLSLRLILKASSSLDELRKSITDIKESKHEMLIYKSTNYDAVYNLVNNIKEYELTDLFQYSVTALLLALYLKNNTSYMNKDSNDKDLKFLADVLLRHIIQLVCNGHAICDTFLKVYENSIDTETEERIGTAIYPCASMMNHSCQPSIINSFYNNILVVRAAKEIRKGEEVCNCYGPDARRMKRTERQEILKKQYFFTCQCEACLEKHDFWEILTALKCPECKGAFVPKEENSQSCVCVECGQSSKISSEVREKEILFYSLIKKGEDVMDENITLRLLMFLKIWRLGREIFYKFHKDLCYAADEVARCLAVQEDFRRCFLFLKCCVLSIEKRFGSVSIELAKEMKKLGGAILRYSLDSRQNVDRLTDRIDRKTVQEGVLYYEKAENIISLLLGPVHQEVEEIKANIRILQGQL